MQDSRNSKGGDPPVTRLYHAEQTGRGHWLEGDLAAGRYRRQDTERLSKDLACDLTIFIFWGTKIIAI